MLDFGRDDSHHEVGGAAPQVLIAAVCSPKMRSAGPSASYKLDALDRNRVLDAAMRIEASDLADARHHQRNG
jgi:hypothetical protein